MMKAAQIYSYGGTDVIQFTEAINPVPEAGEVLIRVSAAGVGPWDAFVRAGISAIEQPLPLVLGSDLSGTIVELGPGVEHFGIGDEVFGVTNPQFTGAYAEYAVAKVAMLHLKPSNITHVEAASVPVVAITAWQSLFEFANLSEGQSVLIHGAAGNVGAYATQLAHNAGLKVVATASASDAEFVIELGAELVIDYKNERFEEIVSGVDAVLDTLSGDVLERSVSVLNPDGIIVSIAAPIPENFEKQHGVEAKFFLAEVNTERLEIVARQIESGKLKTNVGTILELEQARLAHEMLAGHPHARGKIILDMSSLLRATE